MEAHPITMVRRTRRPACPSQVISPRPACPCQVLTRPAPSGKTLTMMMGYGGPTMIRFLLGESSEAPSKYRELVLSKIGGVGNCDRTFGMSWAASSAQGYVEALRLLLDAGVDPDTFDVSAMKGAFRLFRGLSNWLMRYRRAPSPGLLAMLGFAMNGTCLHIASYGGRLPCVKLLIERGSDVNQQSLNTVRMSPLMSASAGGHDLVAEALLDAGANPNLKDKGGKTAARWARAFGHVGLARKLEARMTPRKTTGAKKYQVAPEADHGGERK